MIIENKKTAIWVRLRALILAIVFTTIIVVIFTSGWFDKPLAGISKTHYAVFVLSVYIIISFYFYALELNYFYFNDEGQKLIVRYYSLRPFHELKRSVEIPKQDFAKFELHKTFFGQKTYLILYQRMKKNIAKYPPISISSLTKDEWNNLNKALIRSLPG